MEKKPTKNRKSLTGTVKGFVEMTDTLGNRCLVKCSSIVKICERRRYRNREFSECPELREVSEDGKKEFIHESTYIQSEFPCHDMYVQETYDVVVQMIRNALEP